MAEPETDPTRPTDLRPGLGPWRQAEPPEGFSPFPDEAVGATLAERFFEIVERHPERIALRGPAGTWIYAELGELVRGRAGAIQQVVDPSTPTPVCVLMTHDAPLAATIVTVIAAGHLVVVLDPVAPAEQNLHVLAESGAPLLLHDAAQAEAADALAAAAGRDLEVLDVESLTAADLSPIERGPSDPIMLAFTSGTSGSPKGGIITNAVLMNLVRGATNALGITADDRMPMLFPTSMAVAAYPMFLPLLNGGTLATLDVRSVGLAPMADFLADERITLAYMAPVVVRFLVDALAGREFPDLRMIALGGELVDAEAVRITKDLLDPEWMANGFGTTETGVITLYVFDPEHPLEGAVPAGYSVPEVELHILDDHGDEVPVGESGEVAIASPHVFLGYWGHPELTEQVLAPDPQGRPGWQLYRTGDLGRLDEHGALVVLGRLDTKVKVRGRFVVLGDVESDLHELERVADAAVVAVTTDGITELTAVVVPAGDEPVTGADLRAELLERHDAYRVPARWVFVPELPRLPNGKLDRRGLEPAGADGADAGGDAPADRSGPTPTGADDPAEDVALVRALRDIWELLLPVGVVGVDDDFGHLGGDSLLAAQMLVLLEQRTGITVPMGDLVHARTIRELAAVAERRRAEGDASPSTVACVQEGDPNRPRLWFVHDLQGSAYRVRHLADELGADQPVWSFESPLLRGEPNHFTELPTFAANYVRDLLEAQPEGPYWLAGYSFGGITAYEMARQLVRDGHEVAFCGVVDVGPGYRGPGWGDRGAPFRPWFGVAKPPPAGASLREQLDHYAEMGKASPKGLARHLMVRTGLAQLIDPRRFQADLRTHGRVRAEWRLWYAWEEHWKLAARHWDRSSPYDGSVDLFWADATPSADATMGWGPLVADLQIHRFAGDHEGILEPRGAAELAKVLRARIDDLLA